MKDGRSSGQNSTPQSDKPNKGPSIIPSKEKVLAPDESIKPVQKSQPKPKNNFSGRTRSMSYEIKGSEIQYIHVEIAPQNSIISSGASMMYFDKGIDMKMRMVGGEEDSSGVIGKLFKLGKSVITGEKMFMMTFLNSTERPRRVAFAAPHPGKIVPIDIQKFGGSVMCQRSSFLLADKGIRIVPASMREIGGGGFSGPAIEMDKLEGNGFAFLHVGGGVFARRLADGESVSASTKAIVAMQTGVKHKVQNIRNVGVTGEGYRLSELTGPGVIWLQSMPFRSLQEKVTAYVKDTLGIKSKNKGITAMFNKE